MIDWMFWPLFVSMIALPIVIGALVLITIVKGRVSLLAYWSLIILCFASSTHGYVAFHLFKTDLEAHAFWTALTALTIYTISAVYLTIHITSVAIGSASELPRVKIRGRQLLKFCATVAGVWVAGILVHGLVYGHF